MPARPYNTPVVSSADNQFTAESVLARDTDQGLNIDFDAQVANMQAHVDEFVAYQARSDIESRDSILAREQAQPGSINWRAQTSTHEVEAPNPHEPTP